MTSLLELPSFGKLMLGLMKNCQSSIEWQHLMKCPALFCSLRFDKRSGTFPCWDVSLNDVTSQLKKPIPRHLIASLTLIRPSELNHLVIPFKVCSMRLGNMLWQLLSISWKSLKPKQFFFFFFLLPFDLSLSISFNQKKEKYIYIQYLSS